LRFDPLPKGFVLSKPVGQEDYDEKVIFDLETRGDLIICNWNHKD